MDKGYVWQGEYGKRSHLIPIFSKILDEQDATSLTMLALFVNNNSYNLEFFIALNYDRPAKDHIQDMMFWFPEIDELEGKGYYMKPYGKDRQVFISHSSKDKEDVRKLIPYLNGMDLPVWFDEYNISAGQSITGSVQSGIEQSEIVIFWVTKNFLESKWCHTEMNAFIKKMIEEDNLLFLMVDDEVEIKELPLFLRDIKHIRRENRSIPDLVEILTGEVKSAISHIKY